MLSPETELTLGLPGREARGPGLKTVRKRGYLDDDDWSTKSQELVGWPPVKAYRRNTVVKSCNKYVKVAVDGAPYLRKVDVERYDSYEQLLSHLENMFSCFTIGNCLKVGEINDQVNGIEYVATYEDKDGDWMLLGDVPWKLFVETCKRVRLMAPSEATGLDLRSPEKCTTG